YCSALLTDGYFFYAPTRTQWFDDYGIQLGTALGKAEKNADGTWQREYQYGTVVVNPSSKTAHIDMNSGQNAKATPTVKATATPTVAAAKPIVKAAATPTVKATDPSSSPHSSSIISAALVNDSVPGISVPSAQTSGVASLPAQPVLEFSLLGLGIPALLAGLVYLLMRR
ncbi:MAG: hypothetical protein ACXW02_07265, partial [Halobacteriota archaeon]